MMLLLLICLCYSRKLEMEENGYVIERSFTKEELDFMVGYDNFKEISMQLYKTNENFELSCIGNLVYLSRKDFEDKIDVKFLFEPNIVDFDFIDTKNTNIFIAKYELISYEDNSKKVEIRDLLSIKYVEKNNVVFTNDIKDAYLTNEILRSICISKFDEMNYKPSIKNLFTRHEKRLKKFDDQKMVLLHNHHLIGISNLFNNEKDRKMFNKILSISSEIEDFEIEYLYKLISNEIKTLCDKKEFNMSESNTVNTLSSVSYLLRILEMEAAFVYELKFTLFPIFICDPEKNMTSAIKCKYSHKYFEKAFENKTNEEFYEVKSSKPEFFVDDIRIEHVETKPIIHYVFVNRN